LKIKPPKEKDICKAFYKQYKELKAYNQFKNNAFVFHIANEQNCNRSYTIMLKGMGLTAGVADYCVITNDGRVAFIEFKRDAKCKLSPKQLEFKAECEQRDIVYKVVWNVDEAIKFLSGNTILT
jgi:hypothetical protein